MTDWVHVFDDHFDIDVPLGSFGTPVTPGATALVDRHWDGLPAAFDTNWWAYPNTFTDTSGHGTYDPNAAIHVASSVAHINLHSAGGVHYAGALIPKVPGAATKGGLGGDWRYSYWLKLGNLVSGDGWKFVPLMWAESNAGPTNNGEFDWPEAWLVGQTIHAFTHLTDFSQDGYDLGQSFQTLLTGWHKFTIERIGSTLNYYLDDVLKHSVSGPTVPTEPMRFILQCETEIGGGASIPTPTSVAELLIDRVLVEVPVTGYRVHVAPAPAGGQPADLAPTVHGLHVAGLDVDTDYTFDVSALDAAGVGDVAELVLRTGSAVIPSDFIYGIPLSLNSTPVGTGTPGKPQGIGVLEGDQSLGVGWSPPLTGDPPTHYRVTVTGPGGPYTVTVVAPSGSAFVGPPTNTLTNGSLYTVTVAASSDGGTTYGPESDQATGIPHAPGAPIKPMLGVTPWRTQYAPITTRILGTDDVGDVVRIDWGPAAGAGALYSTLDACLAAGASELLIICHGHSAEWMSGLGDRDFPTVGQATALHDWFATQFAAIRAHVGAGPIIDAELGNEVTNQGRNPDGSYNGMVDLTGNFIPGKYAFGVDHICQGILAGDPAAFVYTSEPLVSFTLKDPGDPGSNLYFSVSGRNSAGKRMWSGADFHNDLWNDPGNVLAWRTGGIGHQRALAQVPGLRPALHTYSGDRNGATDRDRGLLFPDLASIAAWHASTGGDASTIIWNQHREIKYVARLVHDALVAAGVSSSVAKDRAAVLCSEWGCASAPTWVSGMTFAAGNACYSGGLRYWAKKPHKADATNKPPNGTWWEQNDGYHPATVPNNWNGGEQFTDEPTAGTHTQQALEVHTGKRPDADGVWIMGASAAFPMVRRSCLFIPQDSFGFAYGLFDAGGRAKAQYTAMVGVAKS